MNTHDQLYELIKRHVSDLDVRCEMLVLISTLKMEQYIEGQESIKKIRKQFEKNNN